MIENAIRYWSELQPYRSQRRRCKNYTYGKQWQDIIHDENGMPVTEADYIRRQGSAPLKNNLIRRIVRNVLGVFRNNYRIPDFNNIFPGSSFERDCSPVEAERLRLLYSDCVRLNSLGELYSRVMEEYLIGGMAVVRKRFSLERGGHVMTDMVRTDSFFFNTDATDPRGWDVRFIGEIHSSDLKNADDQQGRIFEIWHHDTENMGEDLWRYKFIDENGRILLEGDSPFPDGSHPYVMKAYPFIDGEIHSFVADCIDQQRYINRLITLNDWIIRGSAKGVLLFPESAIPDDLDLETIAAQWSQYNGVIRYKARTGVPMPQQVATNATNVGITELLQVQLKMMEDVSGINSALQGQLSNGAVSGTLYEQQTRHALTGLTDILEGFREFMREAAMKDISLLRLSA